MERLRPKKAFGQNFLVDHAVLAQIIAAAGVNPEDEVLEIGPGRGALTRLLAEKAARVVAVEIDRDLGALLVRDLARFSNVAIVVGDILKTSLQEILPASGRGGRWKLVANLPYNISSQVLFQILDNLDLFSLLVLMFQKEVGDRLVAVPGTKEYGILSVFCRLHFDVSRVTKVRPGAFYPVPKVESVVLRFDPLATPRVDVGDEGLFRKVVKSAFGQRRKTLWNCLKTGSFCSDSILHEVLTQCNIDAGRRGETLDLEEFASLSRALHTCRSVGNRPQSPATS